MAGTNDLERLKIPVVSTQSRAGTVFTPTSGNPEGGITQDLNEALSQPGYEPVCQAGKHRLIALYGPSPHTNKDTHTVYWVDRIDQEDSSTPWSDSSWEDLANDTEFLQAAQGHFREVQQRDPHIRVYLFMGFIPKQNQAQIDEHILPRGLQSQKRAHFHAAHAIDRQDRVRVLTGEKAADQHDANLISNEGGERAIEYFKQLGLLEGYGRQLTFRQRIGERRPATFIERTIFGFKNLQEAIQQSLALQARTQMMWAEYLSTLATQYHEFAGLILPVLQCLVTSFALIIPSGMDRHNGHTDDDSSVWVMPFATTGGQTVLTPGSVVIDRPH